MGSQVHALEMVETKEDGGPPKESDATIETDPSEKPDNIVVREPRYFDPPDNSRGNCYNCGEGGHTAANCTSAKRQKPCSVCGSLEHNAKQCNKGKDCFICMKGEHGVKDCPEKSKWGSQSAKFCLKCGDSGHEMFSCKSKYAPDDLKEIQCYTCKCFGHVSCVNYAGQGSSKVSCYRCGKLGHSGRECARGHAETSYKWIPSSCRKCGVEGHMPRECPNYAKKKGRESEMSSSRKKRSRGKNKNHLGVGSMPHDSGNFNTRYQTQPSSSLQPNPIGSWMAVHQRAYNHNHNGNHGWGSPAMYAPNARFDGGNGFQPTNSSGFHSNHARLLLQQYGRADGYQHWFPFGSYK